MPHSPKCTPGLSHLYRHTRCPGPEPIILQQRLEGSVPAYKPLLPWELQSWEGGQREGRNSRKVDIYLPKKKIKWPKYDYHSPFKWKEAGMPFCLQLSFPQILYRGEKLLCKMRSTTENKKATFITQLHLYLFKYWLYSYVNDKRPTVPPLNFKIPPSHQNAEANCPPSFSLYLSHNRESRP